MEKFRTKAGKLIEEIIDELNAKLIECGCIYKYAMRQQSGSSDWTIHRVPLSMSFLDSVILNANDGGINFVNELFNKYGVLIAWNNTRNIAWCVKDMSEGDNNGNKIKP